MILFLDFDGVLHPLHDNVPTPENHDNVPTPADQLFCYLPRFEAAMRDFPMVKIVISSGRHWFTLEQLRAIFSQDIADRIIDTTSKTKLADEYLLDKRECEILDWLLATSNEDTQWIAIADAVWQFKKHHDHLVACNWYRGIDDEVESQSRLILERTFHDSIS